MITNECNQVLPAYVPGTHLRTCPTEAAPNKHAVPITLCRKRAAQTLSCCDLICDELFQGLWIAKANAL
eukprot:scaffold211915_cov14-Tisochrysis_lutea.AAC.1